MKREIVITRKNIDDMIKQGHNYSFIGRIWGYSRQSIRQKYLNIKNPDNAKHQKKWRERMKTEEPEKYKEYNRKRNNKKI